MSAPNSDRVTISIKNQIAQVRLNRADKHNALDLEMFKAIVAVQKQIASSRSLRAVVLGAEGSDFCSGLDVKSLMSSRRGALTLLAKWLPWRANLAQKVSVGWRELQIPVIAAVNGRCWGGGLQIALGADFRFVHPEASLSIMEGKWGLIPDMGGTLALRELTHRDQAMRLAMTAEEFTASRGLELGLVTGLSESPWQDAMNLAQQLCQKSPDAIAAVKRLYRKSWHGRPGTALARESGYQWRILLGANQRIALRRQRGDDIEFRQAGKW
jgi:enoyl-CoA hydratase/carnithine racemase